LAYRFFGEKPGSNDSLLLRSEIINYSKLLLFLLVIDRWEVGLSSDEEILTSPSSITAGAAAAIKNISSKEERQTRSGNQGARGGGKGGMTR
jgi:hypothetical protein